MRLPAQIKFLGALLLINVSTKDTVLYWAITEAVQAEDPVADVMRTERN